MRSRTWSAVVLVLAATACTNHPTAPSRAVAASAVSLAALPLGDGHVSTTTAARGSVLACRVLAGGGGAQAAGAWLDEAAGTWSYPAKPHVQGSVTWPDASYSDVVAAGVRTLRTAGVPVHEPTGTFPVAATDPAYAFDRNPNAITVRQLTFSVPAAPVAAAAPGCLPGGPIGVLVDGVVLFDALDGEGRDAVAHEVQDRCDGHPERTGTYHVHWVPSCDAGGVASSAVVGWALDGYPVTGAVDPATHRTWATADLDACHGRTSDYLLDGTTRSGYHYVATSTYPYTLGCFHGTPTTSGRRGPGTHASVPRPADAAGHLPGSARLSG